MTDPRDLTTLANLKAWLNFTAASEDDLLGRLITAESVFIENWLGRPVAEATYIETHDGTGGRGLTLAVSPIASVASVTIDGKTIPASFDVTCPGYIFGPIRSRSR